MIYITGDKHGDIRPIQQFAYEARTTREDILIILGDAGFNYFVELDQETGKYIDAGASKIHKRLSKIPLTIAVVQGNHEAPAWYCDGFLPISWHNGIAYQHPSYPNVVYLKNGEIYDLEGKEYLVMGGAYSVDKIWARRTVPLKGEVVRRPRANWFPEEQMTDQEFQDAEIKMKARNYKVHGILSHTAPLSKRPQEMLFDTGKDLDICDKRMEREFDKLKDRYQFYIWYFGHYHTDRWIDDKFKVLFNGVENLR